MNWGQHDEITVCGYQIKKFLDILFWKFSRSFWKITMKLCKCVSLIIYDEWVQNLFKLIHYSTIITYSDSDFDGSWSWVSLNRLVNHKETFRDDSWWSRRQNTWYIIKFYLLFNSCWQWAVVLCSYKS